MKLYKVHIEVEGAVLAEDEHEASVYADQIVDDLSTLSDCTEVNEIKPFHGKPIYPDGWGGKDLVYNGESKDITFDQAWEQYGEKEKDTKTLQLPFPDKKQGERS